MSDYIHLDSTDHGLLSKSPLDNSLVQDKDCLVDIELTELNSIDSPTVENENENNEDLGIDETSDLITRVKVLGKLAIPVIFSFFLGLGGSFISLFFAGQYKGLDGSSDATVFAGVSLANMFANVSCLSLLIGMSGAVETLGSQFNGSKKYKQVGIVLQRSILILSIMVVPILCMWYFAKEIFVKLGVELAVCEVIAKYLKIRALTMPMDVISESYEKYLMSIGVATPSLYANITFNLSLLILDLIFVVKFKFDYPCLAWAYVIAVYLSGITQICFSLKYEEVKRTLQPWDRSSLKDWKEFISLGLPGTVMLCSEWVRLS